MEPRHADRREYRAALEGLDFPASPSAILRKAHDHGGIDSEVLFILEQLPDETYGSLEELETAIEQVYEESGGLVGGGPAAKSKANQRDKDIIESRADTREGERNDPNF